MKSDFHVTLRIRSPEILLKYHRIIAIRIRRLKLPHLQFIVVGSSVPPASRLFCCASPAPYLLDRLTPLLIRCLRCFARRPSLGIRLVAELVGTFVEAGTVDTAKASSAVLPISGFFISFLWSFSALQLLWIFVLEEGSECIREFAYCWQELLVMKRP